MSHFWEFAIQALESKKEELQQNLTFHTFW